MFEEKYQGSFMTVFYSVGSKPLSNWAVQCKGGGDLRIIEDDVIQSNVLQIMSQNVNACSISSPLDPKGSLAIRLPVLTVLLKNLGRYFTFEVTVMDSQNIRRRFRVSNYTKTTRVSQHMCSMPMIFSEGWNQIQLDMAEFTNQMYKTSFVETVRVQVHANCRLRRVYFTDQKYSEDQIPNEYRMYRTKMVRVQPVVTMPKKKVKKQP